MSGSAHHLKADAGLDRLELVQQQHRLGRRECSSDGMILSGRVTLQWKRSPPSIGGCDRAASRTMDGILGMGCLKNEREYGENGEAKYGEGQPSPHAFLA